MVIWGQLGRGMPPPPTPPAALGPPPRPPMSAQPVPPDPPAARSGGGGFVVSGVKLRAPHAPKATAATTGPHAIERPTRPISTLNMADPPAGLLAATAGPDESPRPFGPSLIEPAIWLATTATPVTGRTRP